ncbi:hypothetical protein FVE85_4957 [Porphyridium purpureum]|uniref:Uncharacterized protein n=1 Tax=Porphyridium purpureum TaxID=35688 RepID=A0A5J4YSD4_PORPP|nr:hypothetical protein FVE85_4957 [Porphyridium purpureum]|eukprot:POR5208..scf236_6
MIRYGAAGRAAPTGLWVDARDAFDDAVCADGAGACGDAAVMCAPQHEHQQEAEGECPFVETALRLMVQENERKRRMQSGKVAGGTDCVPRRPGPQLDAAVPRRLVVLRVHSKAAWKSGSRPDVHKLRRTHTGTQAKPCSAPLVRRGKTKLQGHVQSLEDELFFSLTEPERMQQHDDAQALALILSNHTKACQIFAQHPESALSFVEKSARASAHPRSAVNADRLSLICCALLVGIGELSANLKKETASWMVSEAARMLAKYDTEMGADESRATETDTGPVRPSSLALRALQSIICTHDSGPDLVSLLDSARAQRVFAVLVSDSKPGTSSSPCALPDILSALCLLECWSLVHDHALVRAGFAAESCFARLLGFLDEAPDLHTATNKGEHAKGVQVSTNLMELVRDALHVTHEALFCQVLRVLINAMHDQACVQAALDSGQMWHAADSLAALLSRAATFDMRVLVFASVAQLLSVLPSNASRAHLECLASILSSSMNTHLATHPLNFSDGDTCIESSYVGLLLAVGLCHDAPTLRRTFAALLWHATPQIKLHVVVDALAVLKHASAESGISSLRVDARTDELAERLKLVDLEALANG